MWPARAKLSQDKPPEAVDGVVRNLARPGRYANPALAAQMRRLRQG